MPVSRIGIVTARDQRMTDEMTSTEQELREAVRLLKEAGVDVKKPMHRVPYRAIRSL